MRIFSPRWRGRPVRPRLLYLSPVMPAITGNGLAMRAGMVLRLLAGRYEVCLCVAPLYAPAAPGLPPELAAACSDVVVLGSTGHPLRTRRVGWPTVFARRPAVPPKAARFQVVHVFRLAMLPFARSSGEPGRPGGPAWHLDLDEVESVTHARLAALYRATGKAEQAQHEEREAERCLGLEAIVLREFDRVYVCSERDRGRLRQRPGRAEVRVLPNALPMPTVASVPRRRKPHFTLLFVGTLGYYPNADAVTYFGAEVLPLLRAAAPGRFQVCVVGTGSLTLRSRFVDAPEVHVLGAMPSLATVYAEADAVIVPLRVGGGTRIKVLEAFAFRRPVVSTSIGIEGIDARPEVHVLVGDDPETFARHCLRLMLDPQLGDRLVTDAWSLFTRTYSMEALASAGAVE